MSAPRPRTRRLGALVATLLVAPLLAVSLTSAPAAAGAPYVVTLTSSNSTITYGAKVTLRGKVSPAADGQRVKVQRRIESGAWATIATPRLSTSSTYSLVTTPSKGRTSYRVIKSASNGHAADASPTVLVKAWRWRTLVGVAPKASNDLRTGTYAQDGFTHGAGVSLGNTGYVQWRVISWRCTRARAVVGVPDTAPDGTTYNGVISWAEDDGDDLGDAEFTMRKYDSPRVFMMNSRYSTLVADDTVQFEAYRADGGSADSSARLVFAAPAVYCNS
ncbi:hypothetical protein ASE01_08460 [Nocardioides sp. Root190]|uniref:hypothetical protein n=1 Tax=Nocardioides sp. Root190 TaxID=1736488 RepID=UPI0006F9F2C8|nr:hypothetical protein [Nocardioides sp. Root190]KRB78176.1 hypothetical protein ASE01_08460 [Nocardioides sp. Root190]